MIETIWSAVIVIIIIILFFTCVRYVEKFPYGSHRRLSAKSYKNHDARALLLNFRKNPRDIPHDLLAEILVLIRAEIFGAESSGLGDKKVKIREVKTKEKIREEKIYEAVAEIKAELAVHSDKVLGDSTYEAVNEKRDIIDDIYAYTFIIPLPLAIYEKICFIKRFFNRGGFTSGDFNSVEKNMGSGPAKNTTNVRGYTGDLRQRPQGAPGSQFLRRRGLAYERAINSEGEIIETDNPRIPDIYLVPWEE